MKEICDARGIKIISSVPYSPSSNGVAERLVGVATRGTRAMLHGANLPPRFWAEAMTTYMYLRNRTPTTANDGKTPYEVFYNIKPNISHIRPFGCKTKITLPSEKLKKLDDRAVMGYLLGYKYEGGYRVWIPNQGVKEARDVTFYEDAAPVLPEDDADTAPPAMSWQLETPPASSSHSSPDPQTMPNVHDVDEPPRDKITIRIPGRYHPRAPRPSHREASADTHEEPMDTDHDGTDRAPRYVGRIHDYPDRSSRSGLVRNAGGGATMRDTGGEGAMLAYGAFEVLESAFTPTPTTPNPLTVHEAFSAPDANEWTAAMDDEINNMRRLNVFKEVPRPKAHNIITPKWVFRRKFEDGILVKHKARLVA